VTPRFYLVTAGGGHLPAKRENNKEGKIDGDGRAEPPAEEPLLVVQKVLARERKIAEKFPSGAKLAIEAPRNQEAQRTCRMGIWPRTKRGTEKKKRGKGNGQKKQTST